MPGRVTLASIARDAGVSLTTVSKVLNGGDDISAVTRARVERVLQGSGYGRSRFRAGSDMVEIVRGPVEAARALEIIEGVRATAAALGKSTMLVGRDQTDQAGDWLVGTIRRRPAAVIALGAFGARSRPALEARGIPLVVVAQKVPAASGMRVVAVAEAAGAFVGTGHLVALGHRRIAVVADASDAATADDRVDGYRAAMAAADLPVSPGWVRFADGTEGAFRSALGLLDDPNPPTALLVAGDVQAIGVLQAAAARGLSVPGELSVVIFDDARASRYLLTGLTSIRSPLGVVGEEASRLALAALAGSPAPVRSVAVVPLLIGGSSSTAPATA